MSLYHIYYLFQHSALLMPWEYSGRIYKKKICWHGHIFTEVGINCE